MESSGIDGGILTFRDTAKKWSFAKVDNNGLVTEVAEKNPISDIATVGLYYWKQGKDFVEAAEQMISKNIRTNNEFYVCPSFNEAILNGKKIKTFEIAKECMHGVGTPEDLAIYLGS
jgi:dTDP-glucose pyrophosphorylase